MSRNAPTHTHTLGCTHTHSTKNGAHLYAVAGVVGLSDQQGLLDDRIQQGQEDLCSYLWRREREGSSAQLSRAQLSFSPWLRQKPAPYSTQHLLCGGKSILMEAGGEMRACPCTE